MRMSVDITKEEFKNGVIKSLKHHFSDYSDEINGNTLLKGDLGSTSGKLGYCLQSIMNEFNFNFTYEAIAPTYDEIYDNDMDVKDLIATLECFAGL